MFGLSLIIGVQQARARAQGGEKEDLHGLAVEFERESQHRVIHGQLNPQILTPKQQALPAKSAADLCRGTALAEGVEQVIQQAPGREREGGRKGAAQPLSGPGIAMRMRSTRRGLALGEHVVLFRPQPQLTHPQQRLQPPSTYGAARHERAGSDYTVGGREERMRRGRGRGMEREREEREGERDLEEEEAVVLSEALLDFFEVGHLEVRCLLLLHRVPGPQSVLASHTQLHPPNSSLQASSQCRSY
eukprot:161000-Rhodomonas_salina.1